MNSETEIVPLDPPRWPKGPSICPVANLPAFETQAVMKEFHEANGPGCKVIREYLCRRCGHWHMVTRAPDPTGGSSGTGRSSKWEEVE